MASELLSHVCWLSLSEIVRRSTVIEPALKQVADIENRILYFWHDVLMPFYAGKWEGGSCEVSTAIVFAAMEEVGNYIMGNVKNVSRLVLADESTHQYGVPLTSA